MQRRSLGFKGLGSRVLVGTSKRGRLRVRTDGFHHCSFGSQVHVALAMQ